MLLYWLHVENGITVPSKFVEHMEDFDQTLLHSEHDLERQAKGR